MQAVFPWMIIMLNDEGAAVRVACKRALRAVGTVLFEGCEELLTLLQVMSPSAHI